MDNHPSPALLEAQAQLEKLRARHAARKAAIEARPAPAPDCDPDLARGGLATAVLDGVEPEPVGAGTRYSSSPTGSPFSSNNDVTTSNSARRSASAPHDRETLERGGDNAASVAVARPGGADRQPALSPSGRVSHQHNNGVNTLQLPPWWGEAVATVAAGRQWESATLTAAIRRSLANREGEGASASAWAAQLAEQAIEARTRLKEKKEAAGDIGHEEPHSISTSGGAKNYTMLGAAVNRTGEAKYYRIWLLARYLDTAGSGWVAIDELRETLCASGSPLRISKATTSDKSAWRNLRQLLNGGEGHYWTREIGRNGVERLRYVTPADLAHRLGVQRLVGDPVIIPINVLTSSHVADLKAHLVKGVHASRQGEDDRTSPISRGTLARMNGVSERTLRRYDKRADVTAIPNYEIGEVATTSAMQDAAWEHGNAIFEFVDYKGREGRPGRKYIARVLPNAYAVEMQTAPRGRQRKINKRLRDACDNGAQANGDAYQKFFYESAVNAGDAFNKRPDHPVYYKNGQLRNGAGLWRKFG